MTMANIKIKIEISDSGYAEIRNLFCQHLDELACGCGRNAELRDYYTQAKLRAENNDPPRDELAVWIAGRAGAGMIVESPVTIESWDIDN